MIISLIAAVAHNNAIGKNNQLPWQLPEDLQFFKKTTLGKPVIMGSKTFASLKKPLPGRKNIVLSRNPDIQLPESVMVSSSLQNALDNLDKTQTEECFIIGGGEIFELAMPIADCMYITKIDAIISDADAFFPFIDHTHWKMVWEEKHQANEKNIYNFSFQKYERIEL